MYYLTYLVFALLVAVPASATRKYYPENFYRQYADLMFYGKEQLQRLYKLKEALITAGIMPNMVNYFDPQLILATGFDTNDKFRPDNLGGRRNLKIFERPFVELRTGLAPFCPMDTTFIVAMTGDPDVPPDGASGNWHQYCRWIAYGIPWQQSGPHLEDHELWMLRTCRAAGLHLGKSKAFQPLTDLVPYQPPVLDDMKKWPELHHRQIFIVYAPTNGTNETLSLTLPRERLRWGYDKQNHGVREWAKENGLSPVAANFYNIDLFYVDDGGHP